MKSKMYLLVFLALGLVAFAQTNSPASSLDPSSAPFPSSKQAFWTWGIAFVTPVLVWLLGKIERVPRPVLPTVTPFIGIALGYALQRLGQMNYSWWDSAQAGAAAVAVREIVNGWVTKQYKPGEASKTDARSIDDTVTVQKATVIKTALLLFAPFFALSAVAATNDPVYKLPEKTEWTLAWTHLREDSEVVYTVHQTGFTNTLRTLTTNEFTIKGVTNGLTYLQAPVPGLDKGTNGLYMVARYPGFTTLTSDPSTNLWIKWLGKLEPTQGLVKP